MPTDPSTQFPSHYSPAPSPFNRGPMTSVEGDYAPPAPGSSQGIPSSFGGNVDLASAFEGTLSDMRAVAQQTIKTLSDIGVMAQRVSSMLGGTDKGFEAAPPIPNQVPQLFSSNNTSANIAAAISQATGASYGSAANATPQFNPSFGSMPPEITNPSFASIPSGFGAGPTAQPIPNPVPASPADQTAPGGGPDSSHDADIQRIKHLTETAIGGEFMKNEGGATAGGVKSLLTHPSVRGITQNLATKLGSINPKWKGGQIKYTGRGKDFGSGAAWNTVPEKVQTRLANAAMGGDPDAIKALQTAAIEGIPMETSGIGGAIGSLASGGSLFEAAGAGLGGGVMAGVGIAALPVAAAVLGLHEMEAQRATNAAIQSQIGGSNLSAYGTRAQGLGYSLANLGTMSMGMSNQAFMGVTDLGLQGGARSNALSFVQSNYSNMGMSVSDSMELVTASVKAGSAHLTQLAATLDAVTNSAAAASVNTEQARQGFTGLFQGAITSGMSTSGAATFAGASQMLTNNLGITGEGAKFMQAPNALTAAAMGVSIPQYEVNISNPKTGGQYGAQAQQLVTKQGLSPWFANLGPQAKQQAKMELKNQSGVSSEFHTSFLTANNLTNEQLPGILQRSGIDTSNMTLPDGQPNYSGMIGILASQYLYPNQTTTAYSKTGADQAINAKVKQLTGAEESGFFGNAFTHSNGGQLTNAGWNTTNYINNHGSNSKGAATAASLLANASQLRVTGIGFGPQGSAAPDDYETVQAALGGSSTFQKLIKGQGTITLADGTKESIGKFVAAHKMALTPPSNTSGNNSNNNGNANTLGLTPAAAQLVQILPSAAAQAGNTYGTTPPTGVSPNNNAFSGG